MLVKRPSLSCLGAVLVAIAIVPHAQERPSKQQERDERLAMYLRVGQYADASRLIDEMLKTEPRDDLRNVRAIFGNGRNMRVRHGSASFTCDVSDGVRLPLTVDGRRVNWLVDTGANITTISDAEATRLGLAIRQSEGLAQDLAGGSTGVRTATARRVVIGRSELRDVPFLITPADQMPWKELAPGKQGILGLPVVIALDALRWTRAGTCQTGSAATDRAPAVERPNLTYDGTSVIVNVEFDGKTLEFVLDTGNQAGTQLWERFRMDYQALVRERGIQATVRVAQIGGANDREAVVIPDVRLRVGSKEITLARGNIFSKPVGNDRQHGLLGMDVLNQAAQVTVDFQTMTLTLR